MPDRGPGLQREVGADATDEIGQTDLDRRLLQRRAILAPYAIEVDGTAPASGCGGVGLLDAVGMPPRGDEPRDRNFVERDRLPGDRTSPPHLDVWIPTTEYEPDVRAGNVQHDAERTVLIRIELAGLRQQIDVRRVAAGEALLHLKSNLVRTFRS